MFGLTSFHNIKTSKVMLEEHVVYRLVIIGDKEASDRLKTKYGDLCFETVAMSKV